MIETPPPTGANDMPRWINSSGTLPTLVRYASVGATSAGLELAIFQLLHRLIGLHVMAANVLAIATIVLFGFIAQKRFTFRNREPAAAQARRYVLLVLMSFALNNALVYLFAIGLGWPALLAKISQLGLSFAFNFTVSRYFVFARASAGQD